MIPSTSRRSSVYTGTGAVDAYDFAFKVFADADVRVDVTDTNNVTTTLVLNTGYTISRNADQDTFPGGTITLTAPLTLGYQLVMIGNTAYSQTAQLPAGGAYNAAVLERALDRLAMQSQQLSELLSRALTVPATLVGLNLDLPVPEASTLIGWDATATGLTNYSGASSVAVSTAMTPVVQAASLAAGRTALGASTSGATVFTGTPAQGRTALGSTTIGDAVFIAASKAAAYAALGPLRGHIAGLTLSTAGSSATFTVAVGEAADSTSAALLQLAASISKTTAAWAVGTGNGGLDTGAVANNTWYHVHLVRRPDTGVVDVLFSLSPTAPTMPAGYTQFRRIGSLRTNGSAQWTRFFQEGDYFRWDTSVADLSAANPGAAAVLRTLTVPTGVKVRVFGHVGINAPDYVYIIDPAAQDLTPDTTRCTLANGNAGRVDVTYTCMTDTSGRVRSRLNSGAAITLNMSTDGWFDTRGRDA